MMIPDDLPKPLHAALTNLAAANRRSINAEVVTAIEAYVATDKQEERCKRCGGFPWTRLHVRTCVKPFEPQCCHKCGQAFSSNVHLERCLKPRRRTAIVMKRAKGKRNA